MYDFKAKADEFSKEVKMYVGTAKSNSITQAQDLLEDQTEMFSMVLEELTRRGQDTQEKVQELTSSFWYEIKSSMQKLIGKFTDLWNKFIELFKPKAGTLLLLE